MRWRLRAWRRRWVLSGRLLRGNFDVLFIKPQILVGVQIEPTGTRFIVPTH
jgi:hypothetical protein